MIQAFVATPIKHTLPTMMELVPNPHHENWTQLGFAGNLDIGTIQELKGT